MDARDEYGWICEYVTAGIPPDKRLAVINLIKFGGIELIKNLLDYPNVQTQLYCVDALLFINYQNETKIKKLAIKSDNNSIEMISYLKSNLIDS